MYVVIVIIAVAVISAGSFYYRKVMLEKFANDPEAFAKYNQTDVADDDGFVDFLAMGDKPLKEFKGENPDTKKSLELESGQEVSVDKLPLMSFGLIYKKRFASHDPVRWYGAHGTIKNVAKYSLKEPWDITDRDSALEVLNALANLAQTESFDMNNLMNDKLADFWQKYYNSPIESRKDAFDESLLKQMYSELPDLLKDQQLYAGLHKMSFNYADIAQVKGIQAWDIERLSGVAQYCCFVGFISEEELFSYLERAKELANKHYANWREYSLGYLLGRASLYASDDVLFLADTIQGLLKYENSLWNEFNLWNQSF